MNAMKLEMKTVEAIAAFTLSDAHQIFLWDAGGSTQGHKSNAGAGCREWLITESENMVSYG
ncbi:hypothetical protein [Endozoicomonas ascidiicola]|uniref:hypothetical protein n=1 Tax=Endozoicomonas ascidiicola TaxID=1698521 RepID=UPI0008369698|nr:hypothetical protein [Endozoicomonas ascidiicola]